MINIYKNIFLYIIIVFCLVLLLASTLFAQGVSNDIQATCAQTGDNTFCQDYNEGKNSSADKGPLQQIISTVISVFAYFGGAIAFIYLIYGGFKYVTSAGNSEKASSGRQTIIYALVGLVIIVVAQQLVLFIISKL